MKMIAGLNLAITFKLLLVITIFPAGLATKAQEQGSSNRIGHYIRLNDSETRLVEFKDSNEILELKLKQLDVINKSRKRFNAPPLQLDILASRVANRQCREAALNGYTGHWNLAGEKPYHRWAFAGGKDHVSENAAGEYTSGVFTHTNDYISKMMISSHEAFMAEKKPYDGHKQAVIEKQHNFVGIGFFINDHQFRYYEEYIDRYYTFGDIPSSLAKGEGFTLEIDPGQGRHLLFLMAYYEKAPTRLSLRQVQSKSSYNDYTEEEAFHVTPWDLEKLKSGSTYYIPLTFDKPGLYYLQLYSGNKPYRQGTQFTTEGKLQASGIVVRVK